MTAPVTTEMAGTIMTQMTSAMGAIFGSVANLSGVIILVGGTFLVLGIVVSILKLRR